MVVGFDEPTLPLGLVGFGAAGLLAGTVGAGLNMGDFFRKTEGEGIWTSIRR